MTARIGAGALLVGVWLLLWADVSIANVVSGVLVVAALFLAFPPALRGSPIRVRPIALLRLAIYFTGQVVVSNLLLVALVFTPESRIRRGVLAVPLEGCSESLVRFVAHLTALTPGTMVVDVRADPSTISVHVLVRRDLEDARRGIVKLNDLVVRAFGPDDEVVGDHARGSS